MAKMICADGSVGYAQTGFSFSSNTCKGWSAGGFKLALRNCVKSDLGRDFRGSLDNKFDSWLKNLKDRGVSIYVISLNVETLEAEKFDLETWYDENMRGN